MPLAGGASQIHDGLIRLIGALRVNTEVDGILRIASAYFISMKTKKRRVSICVDL